MFLLAARHIDTRRFATRFTALEPAPPGPLIRLGREALREAQWSDTVDVHQQPQPASVREIVPLYTCRIVPDEATFYLVAGYRAEATYLVEAWRTPPPHDLTAEDIPGWAQSWYEAQAALNIGPARFGLRVEEQVEVEAKLTLQHESDPLALALVIMDALGTRDTWLTHRILRSHLYAPTSPAGSARYAAFTARPDGGWWAKAKHDGAAGAQTRRELHRVVPDLDAGLAWASAELECELYHLGQMHRTCWDQVTAPDPNGDMSVITVDCARMGGYTLHQVEVEYSARLARLAPTATDARSHVQATAKNLARCLTEAGIGCRHDNLTKIDFFRRAGVPHVG